MDSSVDISSSWPRPQLSASGATVHVSSPILLSIGITVCRVISGHYAIGMHSGDQHIIVDLLPSEFRSFIDRLDALHRQEPDQPPDELLTNRICEEFGRLPSQAQRELEISRDE